MTKKKSVLWSHELVQLVVPSAADVQWRYAHVARQSDDRTVCGIRLRYWWFRDSEIQTVSALRAKWVKETGDPNLHPKLHFQGMHLGGALNIEPWLCSNCHSLVIDGKRPRWASEKDVCLYCYEFHESCHCVNSMTLEESLVLHGFRASDAREEAQP